MQLYTEQACFSITTIMSTPSPTIISSVMDPSTITTNYNSMTTLVRNPGKTNITTTMINTSPTTIMTAAVMKPKLVKYFHSKLNEYSGWHY